MPEYPRGGHASGDAVVSELAVPEALTRPGAGSPRPRAEMSERAILDLLLDRPALLDRANAERARLDALLDEKPFTNRMRQRWEIRQALIGEARIQAARLLHTQACVDNRHGNCAGQRAFGGHGCLCDCHDEEDLSTRQEQARGPKPCTDSGEAEADD
jgi:hypothetical protein